MSAPAHSAPSPHRVEARRFSERLDVRLAAPRGFCAGVERAVRAVEDALARHGAPVYVRHEIVHNAHVVARLAAMGAIFVEDLAAVDPARHVIFSAHGVPKSAHAEAAARGLSAIDATCPLVLKVHNEVRRHVAAGRHVFLVGHRGHPEIIGTAGQAPAGATTIVETAQDAARVLAPEGPLAYATQTTLSVDDAGAIVAVLTKRFPAIEGPRRGDICYATSNRQAAVKLIAPGADVVLVVGSPQSSNSVRLVETARAAGARGALLVDDPSAFDPALLDDARIIGVTAGASTPEHLVEALLARIAGRRTLAIETVEHAREDVTFRQPLAASAGAP